MLGLKTRKSAGVRVTRHTHALISVANAARDAGDWRRAAQGYAKALQADGALTHIFVQLGNMHKELEEWIEAEAAYQAASDLAPGEAEAYLQLGHVSRKRGDAASAAHHYLKAFMNDPGNADALAELLRMIGTSAEPQRMELLRLLRSTDPGLWSAAALTEDAALLGADDELDLPEKQIVKERTSLYFDVSDLLSYFRHARLPTGIQRVQIEVIASIAAEAGDADVRICCFIEGHEDWREVPKAKFLALIQLSMVSDDRLAHDWVSLLNRLRLTLVLSPPMRFLHSATLVNLGTSWWLQNYFLHIREAKRKYNISYVPLVYDLIPVLHPEHCILGLRRDFNSWLLGAFQHADCFLAISEATKRDLMLVAQKLGHAIASDHVRVIPLDADFRKGRAEGKQPDILDFYGLNAGSYVLFVSTIESRKNHILALEAWDKLITEHGVDAVQDLVCVGRRGWLNQGVYDRLSNSPALQRKVKILSGVSDDDLDCLYRDCLFTLYPSLYEGWGLPVTESLCYGKVPVTSDSSSLPEAGRGFAAYFASGSLDELYAVLDRLIFDDDKRAEIEKRIREEFEPRSWMEVAHQISDQISEWKAAGYLHGNQIAVPPIALGRYYSLRRNQQTRIWKNLGLAEIYRAGLGWHWPDSDGCRTRPEGGDLVLPMPADGPVRLYLQLRGVANQDCDYVIRINDGSGMFTGRVQAGTVSWFVGDFYSDGRHDWSVTIIGSDHGEGSGEPGGKPGGAFSVGVVGFFACAVDDQPARARLIEAIALNNFSSIDAYGVPSVEVLEDNRSG